MVEEHSTTGRERWGKNTSNGHVKIALETRRFDLVVFIFKE